MSAPPVPFCLTISIVAAAIIAAPRRRTGRRRDPQDAESCAACHGPNGNSSDPLFPILAGQSWRYIYIQLKDFKEGRRTDPVMSPMAADLRATR